MNRQRFTVTRIHRFLDLETTMAAARPYPRAYFELVHVLELATIV